MTPLEFGNLRKQHVGALIIFCLNCTSSVRMRFSRTKNCCINKLYYQNFKFWKFYLIQFIIAGASTESVDLLPTPGAPGSEWTKTLATDEGHESDQMFEFDGVSSAVAIPNSLLDHSLSSTFTIATWMKHKPQPNQDKYTKEHILCSADDHSKYKWQYFWIFSDVIFTKFSSAEMNRHHYAWFVRNCRLILLLRRDFTQGDLNIFRPAEWRWKLPQVCHFIFDSFTLNQSCFNMMKL